MRLPWPLVFYRDSLGLNVGGKILGPLIFILAKYRDDEGIYRHECFHVAQFFVTWATLAVGMWVGGVHEWWALLFMALGHDVLHKAVRPYRMWSEIAAYRIQMCYPDRSGKLMTREKAAERLTANDHYALGLTYERALRYF